MPAGSESRKRNSEFQREISSQTFPLRSSQYAGKNPSSFLNCFVLSAMVGRGLASSVFAWANAPTENTNARQQTAMRRSRIKEPPKLQSVKTNSLTKNN